MHRSGKEIRARENLPKTAPGKCQRRNWVAASVEIKTHCGEKIRVGAPGKILLWRAFSRMILRNLCDQCGLSFSISPLYWQL